MRKNSLFNQVCEFISSKVNSEYTISEIIKSIEARPNSTQIKNIKVRVEYYQRLLERSGYLKVSGEKIKVLQEIPKELTTSDINMAWRYKDKKDMIEPIKIAQSYRITEKESLFFEDTNPSQQKIDLAINLGVIDSAKAALTQFRSSDALSRARVYNVVSILENISRELKDKI